MVSIEMSVRKAEPALIHPDQRDVERCQRAGDVEHGAVAADDDRQIGQLAGSLQRHDLEIVARDVRRGDRVEQHAHAARLQKARQPQQAAPLISGLLYLPINAMVLNAVVMSPIIDGRRRTVGISRSLGQSWHPNRQSPFPEPSIG